MTALFIVLGSIAVYVSMGLAYTRSQVVDAYRRAINEYSYDEIARSWVRFESTIRAIFWPVFIVVDQIRGKGDHAWGWLFKPVDTRKQQAEQLRADASSWRSKQYDGTPAEREMASELARMCEDRAREVDL